MRDSRWTFVLIRDGESPIRQVKVSPRAAYYGVAGVIALFTGLTAAIGFFGGDGTARLNALRLARENRMLEAELASLRGDVEGLEQRIDLLADAGSDALLLAGMDPLDEEVLKVGVGGPGSTSPDQHPLWALDSVAGEEAFALDYDLNVLERRTLLLSQSFAEALDSLRAHRDLLESTPSILPANGRLTSRFSSARLHPIYNEAVPHEGVDISAPEGTPILAAAKGRVVFAGRRAGYGNMVEIDHGYGYVTRYGHASKILVRRGQTVGRGEMIGQVGRTGIATAPHLHYEVHVNGRARNPLDFVFRE